MSDTSQCQLYVAGVTDKGMVRKHNEDSICVHKALNLFVVADGMGGHGGGDIASRESLEALKHSFMTNNLVLKAQSEARAKGVEQDAVASGDDEFDDDATTPDFQSLAIQPESPQKEPDKDSTDPDFLGSFTKPAIQTASMAVRHANETVYSLNKEKVPKSGRNMGTTIVGIWFYSGLEFAVIFNVGDSRLYRFRGGKMIQLTVDHSLYEKWKTEGMKGPAPKKNIITRAVGPMQSVDPDVNAQRAIPGDLFLICSDGLTGMIDDPTIEEVLSQTDPKNLEKYARELIDLANQNGGKDNVSAILVAYA